MTYTLCPIGILSEEALEARHKEYRAQYTKNIPNKN